MEQEPSILKEASEEFQTVLKWILSGLIEAIFLVCWVIIQWMLNYVISKFQLSGLDQRVFFVAQWLFAISTLAPILFFIVRLLATMAIRTWRYIAEEAKK